MPREHQECNYTGKNKSSELQLLQQYEVCQFSKHIFKLRMQADKIKNNNNNNKK